MDRRDAYSGIGSGLRLAAVALLVFGLTFVFAVLYIA